jgi:type II secretory pathway pseudopilin PulG
VKYKLIERKNLSNKRKLILASALLLIGIVIVSNTIQSIERKEAELNQIRLESEQLQQAKDKLEEDKKKLETDNEKLRKDLQTKREQVKTTVRVASAKADCEAYRPLLEKYPWNVSIAMLVMSKESGCRANAVSRTNDHGLFQLHNQAVYDPAQNIAIAYAKYAGGRVGANNWSAWYAVCTPGNNPQPKYAGVHCK